jgi:tRNA pseudouridine55 synthase
MTKYEKIHFMDQILLIDKPAGITSHDVVDRVRRVFETRRVGHAGTLDPFATGLLIIGVGDATKRLSGYVGLDKTYEATARLGATSTTFDPEGTITETVGAHGNAPECVPPYAPIRSDIERALDKFRGGYEQKAPIYSAKKIGGKKLYELARKGLATEEQRPSKTVTISSLVISHYAFPFLSFTVTCSSGTYIRSLADDTGRELGCGAYLTGLRRTAIGPHKIEDATAIDNLRAP